MIRADGLWDLIEARAAETPAALFAVDEQDRTLSFVEYRDAALRCAAGLASLGVREDTAVSWMLPTWLESFVLVGGLARLGARQNPILPIYRERELRFIAQQSHPRLLLVPGEWRGFDYAAMARKVAADSPGLQVVIVDPVLPDGNPDALPALAEPSGDPPPRWLFYSSGTTADPKGALHTDQTLFAASRGLCRVLELSSDDRIAMVFPFTHIGGIGWLVAGLLAGCAQIAVPAFGPDSIAVLARHGVTQATAGTVFHQAYLAAQRAAPARPLFPNVRAFPGGGAPKPPDLHYDLKRELGGAGIVSGYGLTECPIISMGTVNDPDEKLAHTEGRMNPPETQVRIVDGEIRVKAPQLCKGYLDPALNDAAFDADGWFRTGDLGVVDADGYLVITGRLKDVIIRKGENVSAKEIEDLLYRHPKVADAAVIGLPDPASGERVCAVVRCADPSDPLAFDELAAFLKDQGLAFQKIPEQLELLDEIPRNATGKILKHHLRTRYTRDVPA